MAKFVVTGWDPLGLALMKAAGIDPNSVRRVVIDLQVGSPGRMYLDTFLDDQVLSDVHAAAVADPSIVADLVVERPPSGS